MRHTWKKYGWDILIDLAGGMLIALGTYNFASAANFPMVGVNGISLIFYHLFGIPLGLMAILLNIPIALCCYSILGRDFFLRSLRSMFIASVLMDYVAPLFPLYQGNRLLATLCTGVLSGLGFALIYMRNSSTGGADFIILSLKAKHPHMSLGNLIFALDVLVVGIGAVFISPDVDGIIYGVIVSYLISYVVDKIMYGMDAGKLALIVTESPGKVAAGIGSVIGRGATLLKGRGSYTNEDKDVVMCACNKRQMYQIRSLVKEIDARAFMIIMESNEVLGEGFKED